MILDCIQYCTKHYGMPHEHYATRAQAQAAVFEYIEVYYNRQRRNAAAGNLSPTEFRRRFYQQNAT